MTSTPKENTITATLVLERVYEATPARVFRAWTDAVEMRRWYAADEAHRIESVDVDLRVGGSYRAVFGKPGEKPYEEIGMYREIVPERRLVFEMTLARSGEVFSRSLCTVDLEDLGDGRTRVRLTDQGPDAGAHAQGWTPALELLARHLSR